MPQTSKEIADRIRALAQKHGVTVKQTLDDCSINRNFLYDLDKGNSPSVDKLSRIAQYFGVGISALLEDDEISSLLDIYKKLSKEEKAEFRKYLQSLIE
ncbi:MAG: helix-turn-helix transcriptional regulator [Clostridia bacterium]|nr:helix-turn-helix transcriptional regulator [Clostridia bacterium]